MQDIYPSNKVERVCREILLSIGVRSDVAEEVTCCLIETSLRGIDSHGVNLLPHYIAAVEAGRINPYPNFRFKQTSDTTGVLDADDSFGHAAGSLAMKKAIEMCRKSGSGFVSVYNSTHFSACAYYSLQAAMQNMMGIASTHTESIMLSARGKRAFLGTNPITFTFPCEGEDPICLDMATTQVTWNYVKLAIQNEEKIKPGLAVDKNAEIVCDPEKAAMLLPMGDYKGYALAFVVEILCSILSGMPDGHHLTPMYNSPLSEKRKLGHFFGAIDIGKFIEIDVFKKRLKNLVTDLRNEPAVDPSLPVLVPGDPEKHARAFRKKNGIPLSKQTVRMINKFIIERKLSKEIYL